MSELNSQQLEQVRLCVLRHLSAARTTMYGLSTTLLLQFVKSDGYRTLDTAGLNGELSYLEDKKFIAKLDKKISPENAHWRITADGQDEYAQQTA